MLDDTHFHAMADATLMHCFDQLEDAYERGELEDIELAQGVLSIATAGGRQFVISKHAPSKQVWLASPFSGGLHFSYSVEDQQWIDISGNRLYAILREELARSGANVVL